jgi:hypothetical protein
MQSALYCLVHDPKHRHSGMLGLREHARVPIQRFHQNFTKVILTSKLCYLSTSKLWIYTDYMVAFENSAWMYYIQMLNNDQYPPNKKCLLIKYGFKCVKQSLGSLHCGYYMCDHLRTCGRAVQSKSWRCKSSLFYIFIFSFTIFHCLINSFYCISFLIIGRSEIILLLMICKKLDSTML